MYLRLLPFVSTLPRLPSASSIGVAVVWSTPDPSLLPVETDTPTMSFAYGPTQEYLSTDLPILKQQIGPSSFETEEHGLRNNPLAARNQ